VTDREFLSLMLDELQSSTADDMFAPALRARVCAAIQAAARGNPAPRNASKLAIQLKRMIPERIRMAARSRRSVHPTLNPLVLAFRSFLALRMNALLKLDAATPPAGLQRAVHL